MNQIEADKNIIIQKLTNRIYIHRDEIDEWRPKLTYGRGCEQPSEALVAFREEIEAELGLALFLGGAD